MAEPEKPKAPPVPKEKLAELTKGLPAGPTKIEPISSDPAASVPLVTPIAVVPSLAAFGAIRSPSQGPSKAMEAQFTCETCKGTTIVKIPWNALPIERQVRMKDALDEHRVLCPVGFPEDMRRYRINYPRG